MDFSTIVRSAKGEEPVGGRDFAEMAQHAAIAVSRRTSFMPLGAAALAAAIAGPGLVQAGKTARKGRKRSKKKCKKQVDKCRGSLIALCNDDPECEATFLPCCSDLSDCKAGLSLDCFFSQVN